MGNWCCFTCSRSCQLGRVPPQPIARQPITMGNHCGRLLQPLSEVATAASGRAIVLHSLAGACRRAPALPPTHPTHRLRDDRSQSGDTLALPIHPLHITTGQAGSYYLRYLDQLSLCGFKLLLHCAQEGISSQGQTLYIY